jgi:hypothetical protein
MYDIGRWHGKANKVCKLCKMYAIRYVYPELEVSQKTDLISVPFLKTPHVHPINK